jgi:hypothetical protein
MPVIPVDRVVDKKRIIGKKMMGQKFWVTRDGSGKSADGNAPDDGPEDGCPHDDDAVGGENGVTLRNKKSIRRRVLKQNSVPELAKPDLS